MSQQDALKVSADDITPNTRRGGDLRALLTPATVGSTSGFMGVVTLKPGEVVTEHYHPYSEEFLYLSSGSLAVRLDGTRVELAAGQALLIPREARHRLANEGAEDAHAVFHLAPLAPRPDLGHVDTEAGQ